MNLYKQEKAQLIKDGKLAEYRRKKKECYQNGDFLSSNPENYNLSSLELDLILRLEKSTKRKKQDFRRHTHFMSIKYENTGFLTLSFSDKSLINSSFEWKKQVVTNTLKKCFLDYIGKFELSEKGRLHFHAIVAWNGEVYTRDTIRNNRKSKLVTNKLDLTNEWYGGKLPNGDPAKYGIYDLVLIPNSKTDQDKITNYSMKSLNTMDSYIQKEEELLDNIKVDEELIFKINTSNVITARNTPYQKYKKSQNEQDKDIKQKAMAFDTSFYEENKFNSRKVFRQWAVDNKDLCPTDYLRLFEEDFKIIEPSDFPD